MRLISFQGLKWEFVLWCFTVLVTALWFCFACTSLKYEVRGIMSWQDCVHSVMHIRSHYLLNQGPIFQFKQCMALTDFNMQNQSFSVWDWNQAFITAEGHKVCSKCSFYLFSSLHKFSVIPRTAQVCDMLAEVIVGSSCRVQEWQAPIHWT